MTKQCVLCFRTEQTEAEQVLCHICVQRLFMATEESKLKLRDRLLKKKRLEAVHLVESFIQGEEPEAGTVKPVEKICKNGGPRKSMRTAPIPKKPSRILETKQTPHPHKPAAARKPAGVRKAKLS